MAHKMLPALIACSFILVHSSLLAQKIDTTHKSLSATQLLHKGKNEKAVGASLFAGGMAMLVWGLTSDRTTTTLENFQPIGKREVLSLIGAGMTISGFFVYVDGSKKRRKAKLALSYQPDAFNRSQYIARVRLNLPMY